MPHISVVTPVYGAVGCLEVLYTRLVKSLEKITEDFEIIMVNDACPYGSWGIVKKICKKDKRVKGINLYRNFGQHTAITAGVNNSKGDWVIVMDCDLQDQPEDIPLLYKKALEGNEVVFGVRGKRKDTLFKRGTSRIYQFIFNLLGRVKNDKNNANFSIISRGVADGYNQLLERGRAYFLQVHWVYPNIVFVDVNHDKRYAGNSSYTLSKLIKLASNILIAHSYKPLIIALGLGVCMIILSIILGIKVLISYFFISSEAIGWYSIMTVILLSSGIILFNLGVMSLYIWKTFEETKHMPLYIVKEKVNVR